MITLETRTDDGTPLRRWQESPDAMTEEWRDVLADREAWDYEQHGATETFVILACGEIPLSALATYERGDGPPPFDAATATGMYDAL